MVFLLRSRLQVPTSGGLATAVLLLALASPAHAQQSTPQPAAPTAPSPSTPPPASGSGQSSSTGQSSTTPATTTPAPDPNDPQSGEPTGDPVAGQNRIFGLIPNYTTVEGTAKVPPVTSAQSFKMAAMDSFDPMVYPLFGFIAGVSQIQNEPPEWGKTWSGYAKRYGLAFADNTVCSLMTTGLFPSLLKQDPRYYQGRKTGFFNRVYYAASRSVVTKSRTGETQFNLSEIGGTLVVANVSNLYYPASQRTVPDTFQRWGTQAMWDTFANELKEFWPDIRHALHGL